MKKKSRQATEILERFRKDTGEYSANWVTFGPPLCKLLVSRDCEVCAEFFTLEEAGRRCDFRMDRFQNFGVLFWALFCFLLCVMIPVALWRCTLPEGNPEALAAGLRLRC